MTLNLWERQADLLTLKLAAARKDLSSLLDIANDPRTQGDSKLAECTSTLLIAVRLKIDEYEKALVSARDHLDGNK